MKKLILKKKTLVSLNPNQLQNVLGGEGEAPTYGNNCTDTCGWLCWTNDGDTGDCPSDPQGGCQNSNNLCETVGGEVGAGAGAVGVNPCGWPFRDPVSQNTDCFTQDNCTHTNCTAGCPYTVNDNTCNC